MKVTLAGTEYEIDRLKLGQIQEISIIVAGALDGSADETQQQAMRRLWDRRTGAVSAALARKHPELTREALLDMAITAEEIATAYNDVLEHSGLAKPGEAVAEVDQSTGPLSTGA